MNSLRVFEINGDRFDDLEGFWVEVSRELFNSTVDCRNLDAFNDCLYGGYGTPEEGFVLRWVNSDRSQTVLGHEETARRLEGVLQRCHPSNIPSVSRRLQEARAGRGPTLFDELVEIIREHGKGGPYSEDRIELRLE